MKKKLLLATAFTMLAGCSTTNQQIIVAPQLMTNNQSIYQQIPMQLSITDMRTKQHLVQVLHEGKAAQLFSPANDFSDAIVSTLQKSWQQQGIAFSAVSANNIEVIIDSALISVQQSTLKYTTASELRLRVKITKGDQTQTTNFKSTGSSEGALKADIAVLERDFNQQLGTLLNNILTNSDIQTFLRN